MPPSPTACAFYSPILFHLPRYLIYAARIARIDIYAMPSEPMDYLKQCISSLTAISSFDF
jgi:hypothetical protein